MKKILFACALLLFPLFFLPTPVANAHNPLGATYYLEVEGDFGLLNISLSQVGLDMALIKSYPDKKVENLPDTKYKQLAVQYIKDNFYLTINDQEINILDGGIKLGNHQTDFKFITSELPREVQTLEIQIDAFKENGEHQTIFAMLLNDITSKVILAEDNDYKSSLLIRDNKMIIQDDNINKKILWFALIIPIFMLGGRTLKLGVVG